MLKDNGINEEFIPCWVLVHQMMVTGHTTLFFCPLIDENEDRGRTLFAEKQPSMLRTDNNEKDFDMLKKLLLTNFEKVCFSLSKLL